MKRQHSAFISIVVLFSAGAASAAVINVPGDYPSIQQAIDTADPGDTILVGPGHYVEDLILRPRIILRSVAGPDDTVIEGSFQHNTIVCSEGSVVDGFGIIGSMSPNTSGVKMYRCSMTVRNCEIRRNYFGILATESSSLIENNWIHSNDAGISAVGSTLTIEGNVLENNDWGNIGLNSTSSNYENSVVRGNSLRLASRFDRDNLKVTGPYGEATPLIVGNEFIAVTDVNPSYHILVFDGFPTVRNNTFYRSEYGVYLYHYESANVFGNIFYRTRYPMDGGGTVFFEEDFNAFFDNPGGLTYEGIHDIVQDPMLIDADNWDFRLQVGSPCIDTGDPAWDVPVDGGDRSDIGANEYPIKFNDYGLAFVEEGDSDLDLEIEGARPFQAIRFELTNPLPIPVTIQFWLDKVLRTSVETFFRKEVTVGPEGRMDGIVRIPPDAPMPYTVRAMLGYEGAIILDAESVIMEGDEPVLPSGEGSRPELPAYSSEPDLAPANKSGS